jgi:hypothetical protein
VRIDKSSAFFIGNILLLFNENLLKEVKLDSVYR